MSNEPKSAAMLLEVTSEFLYIQTEAATDDPWGPPMPNGTPFPRFPPSPYNKLFFLGYL
jgi:hypothetical protein